LIGFETHELGTAREMVNDAPSIRLAGVGTHVMSEVLHTFIPAQQILMRKEL
jgi:hypothetical protein